MKFKSILCLGALFFSACAFSQSSPSDYQTCNIVTETVPYYQGTASCIASSIDGSFPWYVNSSVSMTFNTPTTTSDIRLYTSIWATDNDGNFGLAALACVAQIPYSHSEDIDKEVCSFNQALYCSANPSAPLCR